MMTEIKFECSQCRQRILVDSNAAGMATACPTCGSDVTVPKIGGVNDRDYAGPKRTHGRRLGNGESAEKVRGRENHGFVDGHANGAVKIELDQTREQLAAARAEAEAENHSFQSERLALRNELAHVRQKHSAAESRLSETGLELLEAQARIAEQEAEIDQAARALEELRTEIDRLRIDREQTKRLVDDLSASRKETAAVLAQMQALEIDFAAARDLLAEAHRDRTSAL